MYKWKVYNQSDVAEAFEYFGHTVDMYEESLSTVTVSQAIKNTI